MPAGPASIDRRPYPGVHASASDGLLLEGLSAPLLARVEQSSCTTSYSAGAVIFQEGTAARGIYIVRRGHPALSLSSRSGKRLVLKSARPGDVLGLSACVLGKPHGATFESRGPCTLSFIPKHALLRLMRTDNELCFRVAQWLSEEVDRFCRGIDLVGLTRSAEQKLAAFFLQSFAERSTAPPLNGDSLHVHLTHQELSHRVGIARETVTRALRRLQCAGAIEIRGAELYFRDVALLRRIENGTKLRMVQRGT
jgi:CRP-like cAMP-binding protein